MSGMIGSLLASVPVAPTGGQARGWLEQELAKEPYQAAKPSAFDLIAQSVLQWIESLFSAKSDAVTPRLLTLLAIVVIVGLVVAAILLFGVPRLNRRSAVGAGLFGDDDRRSADAIRAAARAATAAGDHSLAVLEWFRATARGLEERTVVAIFPGTTAAGFAEAATRAAPAERGALFAAADVFDQVRYAGRAGTAGQAAGIEALDGRMQQVQLTVESPA